LRAVRATDIRRHSDYLAPLSAKRYAWLSAENVVKIFCAIFVLLSIAGAAPIRAQSQPQSAPATAHAYEYEVSSIRPYKSGNGDVGFHYTPDGFSATNIDLLYLIHLAFGVHSDQIVGLPNSIASETYEIEARMDESVADEIKKLSANQLKSARQQMMQSLLAERFKLAFHRETKEIPAYSLVIANSGFKLRESAPDEVDRQGRTGIHISGSNGAMRGQLVSIASLAQFLSGRLNRIVIDKTGLTGKYDFMLKWTPDRNQLQSPAGFDATSSNAPNSQSTTPAQDSNAPDLFTAVQEQLGLKLKSEKNSVEVVVIDHVEKPSGN
jgi:uncharacterized protein (TIGR03435 family)